MLVVVSYHILSSCLTIFRKTDDLPISAGEGQSQRLESSRNLQNQWAEVPRTRGMVHDYIVSPSLSILYIHGLRSFALGGKQNEKRYGCKFSPLVRKAIRCMVWLDMSKLEAIELSTLRRPLCHALGYWSCWNHVLLMIIAMCSITMGIPSLKHVYMQGGNWGPKHRWMPQSTRFDWKTLYEFFRVTLDYHPKHCVQGKPSMTLSYIQ